MPLPTSQAPLLQSKRAQCWTQARRGAGVAGSCSSISYQDCVQAASRWYWGRQGPQQSGRAATCQFAVLVALRFQVMTAFCELLRHGVGVQAQLSCMIGLHQAPRSAQSFPTNTGSLLWDEAWCGHVQSAMPPHLQLFAIWSDIFGGRGLPGACRLCLGPVKQLGKLRAAPFLRTVPSHQPPADLEDRGVPKAIVDTFLVSLPALVPETAMASGACVSAHANSLLVLDD